MKKAILLASFGVSDLSAKKKCIDTIVNDVKAAFPEYIVKEAYTAVFIRRKMAKQGIMLKSISEALEELLAEGVEEIIVQPTHLTYGEEFLKKIVPETEKYRHSFKSMHLGKPALAASVPEEYIGKMQLLFPLSELMPGEELVMMGHGSPNMHNIVYEWLQMAADGEGLPIHIGVVEENDHPNKHDLIVRLQERKVKSVYLCPLLLCGGEHAQVDMAGDTPGSWKSYLQNIGIKVRCNTSGLGEKADFRNIYINNIRSIIDKN